jgi:hypothetical protein
MAVLKMSPIAAGASKKLARENRFLVELCLPKRTQLDADKHPGGVGSRLAGSCLSKGWLASGWPTTHPES